MAMAFYEMRTYDCFSYLLPYHFIPIPLHLRHIFAFNYMLRV